MTAPDVNDVRAKFEAEFSKPPYEFSMLRWGYEGGWNGQYRQYPVQCAWEGYRAAHADLAGEVRELVERALDAAAFLNGIGRHDRAQPLREAVHAVRSPEADYAALAKHTHQEKP